MSGSGGPYGTVTVPPPPPGPGVQAPFVAPPTDGEKRRRGWAIGLSIAAVLLLCVGGATGFGGLLILSTRVLSEQAVDGFLTALQNEDYEAAYDQLCDPLRQQTSLQQFTLEHSDPRVTGFDVGGAILTEPEIVVPATVQFDDGATRSVRYLIYQDDRAGRFEVCGEAD